MSDVLYFYRQTSAFTYLGPYENFAKNLTDDVKELALLQRRQIIHPVAIINARKGIRADEVELSEIPFDALLFENERFHTAGSIMHELLRRDKNYSLERKTKDKLHLCCREQAILLASILKAKGIPARARSGFAPYISDGTTAFDHWITEWFDEKSGRWILTDADCCEEKIDFDPFDFSRDRFIFGAQAYLGLRKGNFKTEQIRHASNPPTYGIKAALWGMFFDFHSLMNDEIFFWHKPRYLEECNYDLSEQQYKELDDLAELMLEPEKNFHELKKIWDTVPKFRDLAGGFN